MYDCSDRFAEGQVVATFHDSYALLANTARITAFLPTLAERFTRERLDAYAHGMQTKRAPEILLVCVHNRRLLADGGRFRSLLRPTHVHIRTGGSELASGSNPRSATP